jgi:hypothetical protein
MRHTLAAALLVAATAAVTPAAAQPSFSPPALLTSAGQGADAAIVKLALNTQYQLGVEYKPAAVAADLAGKKTLLVVVGTTPEALAASGIDLAQELARVKALLSAAREAGVGIVAIHSGGLARRDKASNQLIELAVPLADCAVVVAAGNGDKLFQKLAASRSIPVVQVDRVTGVGGAVSAMYKR